MRVECWGHQIDIPEPDDQWCERCGEEALPDCAYCQRCLSELLNHKDEMREEDYDNPAIT